MKTTSTENSDGVKDEKLTTLYWLFAIVLFLWFTSCVIIHLRYKTWAIGGTFGDSFGAVNALFSGLAFAGIIFTIILQKRELTLQRLVLIDTRRELKRTAEAQEKSEKALVKQAKSMENSAKLNAMNTIVMYHTQRMGLSDYSWEIRVKSDTTAAAYIGEIEKIIKQIDSETKDA